MPDRRTSGRRDRGSASEEPGRHLRLAGAAAAGLCGGLALVYLFFAALGAVHPGDALIATAAATLMAGVWLAAHLLRRRESTRRGEHMTDRVNR